MTSLVNLLTVLPINLFDTYIVYRFMSIFFGKHKVDTRLVIAIYGVRLVIGTLLNEYLPYPIVTASFFFTSIICITFCYESNITKKILCTIIVYMCALISEFIPALAIQVSDFSFMQRAEYGNYLIYILTKVIYWSTTLLMKKASGIKYDTKLPRIFVCSVIIVPVCSAIVEFIILHQPNFNGTLTLVSLICALSSSFITIYLYDSYSIIFRKRIEAELALQEKEYYKKQSELLQKSQTELQQYRHDTKNRVITVQQMIEQQEYDQALQYTTELAHKLNHITPHSNSGNISIDSIVNYKLSSAIQKGIQIQFELSIPEQLSVDDDDIVVILGNLLDNAIEANERISDTEKRYLELSMKYKTGCLIIRVKNRFDSIVHVHHGTFTSRKQNKRLHGIGLKSVQAAVDHYQGSMTITHEDDIFEVFIMMYL